MPVLVSLLGFDLFNDADCRASTRKAEKHGYKTPVLPVKLIPEARRTRRPGSQRATWQITINHSIIIANIPKVRRTIFMILLVSPTQPCEGKAIASIIRALLKNPFPPLSMSNVTLVYAAR